MLAPIDIPQDILNLHSKSKDLAEEIFNSLEKSTETINVASNTNLAAIYPSSIIYLSEGIFKYLFNDKLIRYYSDGDIISLPESYSMSIKIISEFGGKIITVSKKIFLHELSINEKLITKWFLYQELSDFVLNALLSLHVKDDYQLNIQMKQFEEGEVIIKEGEMPDNVYEIIEGSVSLTVNGKEIAKIQEGEVFGESSLLTNQPRVETVTAIEDSMVQVINGDSFIQMMTHRPAFLHAISTTVANRWIETTKKLSNLLTKVLL